MPTVPIDSLQRLTSAIFVAAGAPKDLADEVADVLADNHLAGHDSHGVLRIPQYLAAIRSEQLFPTARPEIMRETASTALVSGNWTFGQVAANFAVDVAVRKANDQGIAAVSIIQANHTGRLAAFSDKAAARGVVMFMAAGSGADPRTVPYGGRAPALGTNPVAFSIPNGEAPAVTMDYATSAIAAGKVSVARAKNEPLPANAILTSEGQPTTNAEDYYDGGMMLPFGGHKGYALAVVAELLSGPLTGADEHPRGGKETGVFMFAVSQSAFRSAASYTDAVARITERITSVPPADGFDEVLLPGGPESRARVARTRDGVPIPQSTWQTIGKLAAELGVDMPLHDAEPPSLAPPE